MRQRNTYNFAFSKKILNIWSYRFCQVEKYEIMSTLIEKLSTTTPTCVFLVEILLLRWWNVVNHTAVVGARRPKPMPTSSPPPATSSPSQAESQRSDMTGKMNAHDRSFSGERFANAPTAASALETGDCPPEIPSHTRTRIYGIMCGVEKLVKERKTRT